MKYCNSCGTKIEDGLAVCPSCGNPVDSPNSVQVSQNGGNAPQVTVNINNQISQPAGTENSGLKTAAKVFMVLGIIASGWTLIPLAWTIPMTVSVFHDFRDGRPVGMGLKICSLLFVSLVGGILLLCINDRKTA